MQRTNFHTVGDCTFLLSMSNVIVYGGAGALGRHLVSKFTANQWVGIVIGNFIAGTITNT
jgi:nucleoside-diphosphate-sugar epimerase